MFVGTDKTDDEACQDQGHDDENGSLHDPCKLVQMSDVIVTLL